MKDVCFVAPELTSVSVQSDIPSLSRQVPTDMHIGYFVGVLFFFYIFVCLVGYFGPYSISATDLQ